MFSYAQSAVFLVACIVAFGRDLLPQGDVFKQLWSEVGQVPSFVRHEVYSGLVSFYNDCGFLTRQAETAAQRGEVADQPQAQAQTVKRPSNTDPSKRSPWQ